MGGIKKILAFADDHKSKLYLAIVYIALSVICEVIPYVLIYRLMSMFISGHIVHQQVVIISIGVLIFLVLKNTLYGKGLDASHDVAYNALKNIRVELAAKMIRQPMGIIQDKGTGLYKKSFVEDIDSLEVLIAHLIPEGIPYILSPIAVMITLLIVDWRLDLLSIASVPIGLLAVFLMTRIGMKKMIPGFKSLGNMNNAIVDYISGMEVVKTFGKTMASFEKYKTSIENYKDHCLDWLKVRWTFTAVYEAVLPCTVMFLLPVGLSMYLSNRIDLNVYIFSLILSMSVGLTLVKLVRFMPALSQLTYKIDEIQTLFSSEEIHYNGKNLSPQSYDVEYDEVTFAYDKKEVIKNTSFKANGNSITAIVGESGSGKSTLAKLLVKFWDIDKGQIKIGGVSISDMSNDTLMSLVSYVSQDVFLFNISIMENIRIGNQEATDEEVIEAAKLAQCHEFISKLEEGYQTKSGDAGAKLSGGEIQRITIARAILKDSPIIILDEATSATDAENEDQIQDALNHLIEGKTLIVIAHRLSTIVHVDKIILLDRGEIKGIGTHHELLSNSDLYRKLWHAHINATNWEIGDAKEDKHA